MANENLKKLLTEVDQLVADAQISNDLAFRASSLEIALGKVCVYLKGLKREMSRAVEKLLSRGNFDPDASPISLHDLASTDPQLEVFRQQEELIEFLREMKDFLVKQLRFSREDVDAIIEETKKSYHRFIGENLSVTSVDRRIDDLERFFCRPPWDGPDGSGILGPRPGGGGPSGSLKTRMTNILTYTASFSGICSFLYVVLKPIFTGQARTEERADDDYRLQVLAVMLLIGFSKMLDERQEIPMEAVMLPVSGYPVSDTHEPPVGKFARHLVPN